MALITGTPVGNIVSSQAIYIDQPPTFYFQENKTPSGGTVGLLNDPDADGFYWGLSGTTDNPVYEGGCYDSFQVVDVRDINTIRCDTDGDSGTIQRRNALQITFNLKQFFKLTKLRHMLNLGPVTTNAGATEKMGIGQIDNTKFYYLYFPSVYDENTGDYLAWTLHNAQFTQAWTWTYTYGQPATVGIQVTGYADSGKPSQQRFGTILRADPSAI